MSLKQLLTNLFKKREKVEEVDDAPLLEVVEKSSEVEEVQAKNLPSIELTDNHRYQIAKLLGQFMRPSEIKQEMKEKYGLELKSHHIANIKNSNKWETIIKGVSEQYIKGLDEVGGSHKRVRMDRAERLYEMAFSKKDMRNILASIDHQRKEMEGTGNSTNILNITQVNDYAKMTDEEVEFEKQSLLKRLGGTNGNERKEGEAESTK